jgi:hypothetical protein
VRATQTSTDARVLELPEVIREHVHFVDDPRVATLKDVPILVLDYDDDLDLAADVHAKNQYRRMVEAFVEFVRGLQSRQVAHDLPDSVPSFADVQRWTEFYQDE